MNTLVRKLGKYSIAAFIIMLVGVILFFLAPTGWGVGFDSDVVGLLVFVIGLLMLVVGLIVGRVSKDKEHYARNVGITLIVIAVLFVVVTLLLRVFGVME